MNTDSMASGLSGKAVPCPQCGNEIPEFAVACPYCGSRFKVTRSGYCPQCRAMADATAAGTCEKCESEMMDVRVERSLSAPSPPAEGATSAAAAQAVATPAAQDVATPAASQGATAGTGIRDSMGIVGSGLMRTGFILMTLAPVGLIVLVFLQWMAGTEWTSGTSNLFGEEIFVAIRGREAFVMGLTFLAMPVVLFFVGLTGMTLLPRAGRGLRIAGYVLAWLGVAGLIVALWRYSATDGEGNLPWITAVAGFVVLLAGAIVVQTGSRSARQAIKARSGPKTLYRPWGLRTRLWIGVVLWLAGLIVYVVLIVREKGDWTLQRGGYAIGCLIALGLLGAVLALIGRFGRPTAWIDREGHIVQ